MGVVLYERADGIALLRLNRPARLNAMTMELVLELTRWLDVAVRDGNRVVVLTGAGRGFCSGADMKGDEPPVADEHEWTDDPARSPQAAYHGLILKLYELDLPVIAAINGVAVGGGQSLALAADIRIAAASATFGCVFIQRGLTSLDSGNGWLLPRIVGHGIAAELSLTGRTFDAAEALRIGLVSRVVEDDELLPAALETARLIAANAPSAVWMTKRGMHAEAEIPSFRAAIELERRTQRLADLTGERREAVAAFRERRAPDYGGAPAF